MTYALETALGRALIRRVFHRVMMEPSLIHESDDIEVFLSLDDLNDAQLNGDPIPDYGQIAVAEWEGIVTSDVDLLLDVKIRGFSEVPSGSAWLVFRGNVIDRLDQ